MDENHFSKPNLSFADSKSNTLGKQDNVSYNVFNNNELI